MICLNIVECQLLKKIAQSYQDVTLELRACFYKSTPPTNLVNAFLDDATVQRFAEFASKKAKSDPFQFFLSTAHAQFRFSLFLFASSLQTTVPVVKHRHYN